MRQCMLLGAALLLFFSALGTTLAAGEFNADLGEKVLSDLAWPLEVDESKYGCGPMLDPGRTYHVSLKGDDRSDGLAWETAWRTVKRGVKELQAGDTLYIGEGEYTEAPIEISVRSAQEGEPGRPIRIMAAPRQRVVIGGAPLFSDFQKVNGAAYAYVCAFEPVDLRTVWEADTNIALRRVRSVEILNESPGTFCHDSETKKLYVRFSDSRGPAEHRGVYAMLSTGAGGSYYVPGAYLEGLDGLSKPRDARNAFTIHGSYIHLKGIWFKHQTDSVVITANADYRTGRPLPNLELPIGGHHNTVEDCVFFSNEDAGVFVGVGARWTLVKNNTFVRGGVSGGILTQRCTDALILGNRIFTSNSRQRAALNNYAAEADAARIYVLNNLLLDRGSIMWKPPPAESVLQGNVAPGTFYCTGTRNFTPEQRTVIRNNLLGGGIVFEGDLFGPEGANRDCADGGKAFINNVHAEFGSEPFAAARFADPTWNDYRLQSDSPLAGKGAGGFDRGVFPKPQGRIFYVDSMGSDAFAGTSERLALKTLAKAAAMLQAGDTLYLLPGQYAQPLHVTASGNEDRPIRIRAYGRGVAVLPRIEIAGSHVVLEGLVVRGAATDGLWVRVPNVQIRECVIEGSSGAGVRATDGRGLAISRCTLVQNDIGLVLESGSVEATVRDSILAFNRKRQVRLSEDSATGYLAGQNCYFGAGVDEARVFEEMGSVIGAPLFLDVEVHDYRLQWDSPAAWIAGWGEPAGAAAAESRVPEIKEARVTGVRCEAAIVRWETPLDETRCFLEYRPKGKGAWIKVVDPDEGTVHGAGIVGLKPGMQYEYRITASSRRGGEVTCPAAAFVTAEQEVPPFTYYLALDGQDSKDGRTPASAWRTLRKACAEVMPGDTVLVGSGVYHHAIAPLCSGTDAGRITFRKEGEGAVVIDCDRFISPAVKLISRHYVTVDGFSFIHLPTENGNGVFRLRDSRGSEILNCRTDRVMSNGGDLLIAELVRDLRIEGNLFWGGAQQLRFYSGTSNVLVKNNTLAVCNFFHVTVYFTVDGIRFLNNIFYLPCSPGKNNGNYLLRGQVKNFFSDYNLFYSPYPQQRRMGLWQEDTTLRPLMVAEDLDDWKRKMQCDQHSLWADAMFVEAPTLGGTTADFRLKDGSPAIGAGEGGVNLGAPLGTLPEAEQEPVQERKALPPAPRQSP